MQDAFYRDINYLRISVTDRCNLRCVYCMPPEGVAHIPHEEVLSIEEIEELVIAARDAGVTKVRLTGGEPLIRKGIEKLVESLAGIDNIDDIAMTTNGLLLEQMGKKLKNSGLQRVNISLDTLNAGKFKKITRIGNIETVKRGIEAALKLELSPVKINSVIVRGINDDEIMELAKLTYDFPLHVRFIELMPVGQFDEWATGKFVSSNYVLSCIKSAFGGIYPVKKPAGAGPAKYWCLPGAAGTIGFISAVSNHFCKECNRMRLTSTGELRPCLLSDREVDIKSSLRNGASRQDLTGIFSRLAMMKPEKHGMDGKWSEQVKVMSQIGG